MGSETAGHPRQFVLSLRRFSVSGPAGPHKTNLQAQRGQSDLNPPTPNV